MLLLYRSRSNTETLRKKNLHSTMLLLYLGKIRYLGKHAAFTFHYASTLSSKCRDYQYIRPIYIPLCFYFIRRQLKILYQEHMIYIPLCFYFIDFARYFAKLIGKFTFHYASTLSLIRQQYPIFCSLIYIPLCFYFIPIVYKARQPCIQFTFHYASTLSRETVICGSSNVYLHSTMLLLYPSASPPDCPAREFTFHYASTLSALRDR